ncbi:DNA-3-methyladenine glycosylase [Corynebacterium yudongzhengii]|uniref:Putative 3-methyladenine DNA glycosylase n=1 Tax=Corynebacterium yudongzhengii TaxID=2080740 RepID=A0A2U1T451_9CORY|nr:DNA-3-methyladenine glycosylase [Corynebacterium yudongzhengii]AWB80999.1 DNA-3-methyladenine glycosylase [Corynebacterium yudongzhengii]PWC00779.1 DNA-3-methyladenine glycosylase [Corynebacterium yudongzhengii]
MIDFAATADVVAPQLLGAHLTHAGVTLRITEVEAYLGADDPAAHTYRGPTKRNAAMFGAPGRMYVYLSYGIHLAGNIVCAPKGIGHGCLLRAGEVVDGLPVARKRRGNRADFELARGPGNLGQALGLDLADNGASVRGPSFVLEERSRVPEIATSGRVGISRNTEAPLRFFIPGERSVSQRRTPKR